MPLFYKNLLRYTAVTACATLIMSLLPLSASAASAYVNGKLNIISEPGKTDSSFVEFYHDDTKKSLKDLNWADDGYAGKAVKLNGKNEYLRINYQQLQIPNMTFTAWINWQGSPTDKPSDAYNQPLFSMFKNKNSFLTVFPRAVNPSKVKDGGSQDGLSLQFQMDNQNGLKIDCWNPASDGVHYGLPQNEWHHIAVVTNGTTIRLFVDGVQWFQEYMVLGIRQLYMNYLLIGDSFGNGPKLNALLDDVALYNRALSDNQLKRLAGGIGIGDKETVLTTAPDYQPTRPTTTAPSTTAEGVSPPDDSRPIMLYVLLGVSVVVLLGTFVLGFAGKKSKKGGSRHEK